MFFKIIIIILLFLIMISLGMGLWYLWRGDDQSTKMVQSLTWRISLSVLLFALLMLGLWMGWIQPNS